MKNGLISVIVPIYRVEKYLEECVESILRQTYSNLEVILVDDGSPDRCGEICDRYAQADSRVIAVHQKNAGAAAARNAALRIARGAYIAFVDSDDYLEPDAYENLLEALVRSGADIVQGKFRNIYVNGTETNGSSEEAVSFSAAEYLIRFTADWTCALSPDKLFRRHVLSDVFYEEGHLIDDEFFTYRAVMNAGKILCIPTVVYNYRQRASSVMKDRTTIERKCSDIFDYLEKRRDHVSARFPELKAHYEDHYADYLLWLGASSMATKSAVRQIRKRLLAHMARGKVLFWKKGQRKRAVNILSFLVMPAKTGADRTDGARNSEYEFFQ